jgi:hypothetical protein
MGLLPVGTAARRSERTMRNRAFERMLLFMRPLIEGAHFCQSGFVLGE